VFQKRFVYPKIAERQLKISVPKFSFGGIGKNPGFFFSFRLKGLFVKIPKFFRFPPNLPLPIKGPLGAPG